MGCYCTIEWREYLQPWAKALAIKAEGGRTWFNVKRVRATVTDNAHAVTWMATL